MRGGGGMIDFMLFLGFDLSQTDGCTYVRTFVLLESLSRLKRGLKMFNVDSDFARHIWELVESILWRVALEVTVKNWPPVQLSHLRSNFDFTF